jgi:hypothetical protein
LPSLSTPTAPIARVVAEDESVDVDHQQLQVIESPREQRLDLGFRRLHHAAADVFLTEHHVAEFNRRFQVPAAQRGTAFLPCPRKNLDLVFSLQFERAVNKDTVSFQNLALQIEPVRWRGTLSGCTVTVHQHLDGNLTLTHGPHRLGHYTAQGSSLNENPAQPAKAVEKTRDGKAQKPTFHSACKSRIMRGFALSHRHDGGWMINQTGHFTCLGNRTSALAKSLSANSYGLSPADQGCG